MSHIQSTLSRIASAEKLEQKIHYAWKYCQETNVRYTKNIEHRISSPESVATMIWAHGRYGKRSQAIKKLDAINIVCAYLSLRGGNAA